MIPIRLAGKVEEPPNRRRRPFGRLILVSDLAATRLIKRIDYAAGTYARVHDIVEDQRRSVRASSPQGKRRRFAPVLQVVVVSEPSREVAGERGLGGIVRGKGKVARLSARRPKGAGPDAGCQCRHVENPVVGERYCAARTGARVG